MLFPIIEKFKSVCVHVHLDTFASGYWPQMSPNPSCTVNSFFPMLCARGFVKWVPRLSVNILQTILASGSESSKEHRVM